MSAMVATTNRRRMTTSSLTTKIDSGYALTLTLQQVVDQALDVPLDRIPGCTVPLVLRYVVPRVSFARRRRHTCRQQEDRNHSCPAPFRGMPASHPTLSAV